MWFTQTFPVNRVRVVMRGYTLAFMKNAYPPLHREIIMNY